MMELSHSAVAGSMISFESIPSTSVSVNYLAVDSALYRTLRIERTFLSAN